MARLSRHRPPYVAQGTWRSGTLHVWGWNGIDTAPMSWLYSGFRDRDPDGTRSGWHDSPISYGAIGRLSIDVPGRPVLHATAVQLDPMGATVWLSDLPDREYLSDSLHWFGALTTLARALSSTGRIVPVVADEGPFTVARWRPVLDPEIEAHLDRLATSMPPICIAGS